MSETLILGLWLYGPAFVSTNFSETIVVEAHSSSTTVTIASHISLAPTTNFSYNSASVTSSGTASRNPSSSDHSTSQPSGSANLTRGSEAGVSVGAVCGLFVVAGIIVILLKRESGLMHCCDSLRRRVRTSQDHHARAISSARDVAMPDTGPFEKSARTDPDNLVHKMPA